MRTIDLLSGDFYGDTARAAHAWMRANAPVYFDEQNDLWGVATFEGVLAVSHDARTFSSAGGSRPDTGPLPWMIDLDGADHAKRRKIVSQGFTPARVHADAPALEGICDDLLDRVCEQGSCDIVVDLAAPLPMIVIGDMLGVAPDDRDMLLRWSDDLLSSLSGDPTRIEAAAAAFSEYDAYARTTIAARRRAPTDDLFSVLAHAEIDGDRLDDDEIVFESLLLLVGGDETTRHVISGGTDQLLCHDEARQRLIAHPDEVPQAVEEMLRCESPIKNMARTVTTGVELDGTSLAAGDQVLLLYESANFDERHFIDPERFDISRSPNDHVAFGFGPHFCLGASLARLEVPTMVGRMLVRLPDLERASDEPPDRFLGALRELPVRFTPSKPRGTFAG